MREGKAASSIGFLEWESLRGDVLSRKRDRGWTDSVGPSPRSHWLRAARILGTGLTWRCDSAVGPVEPRTSVSPGVRRAPRIQEGCR